jgi:stress response protein YsnF
MTSDPALPPVIGAIADDRDGTALGTVTAVFLDDVTGEPTWVGLTDGVDASPDGADTALIAPIAGARSTGDHLRLAVPAEAVRSAPPTGRTDRLSPAEEEMLRRHYTGGRTAREPSGDRDGADTAMTRSEERLAVSSVREPWTRAVLRVETVTEEIMVPVTVTRQQARIEYLPLRPGDGPTGDGTTGDGPAGAEPGSGDRERRSTGWVTLYGERPVVTVERGPLERVRLTTAWVTEEQTVTDRLRREEIALEGDPPTR